MMQAITTHQITNIVLLWFLLWFPVPSYDIYLLAHNIMSNQSKKFFLEISSVWLRLDPKTNWPQFCHMAELYFLCSLGSRPCCGFNTANGEINGTLTDTIRIDCIARHCQDLYSTQVYLGTRHTHLLYFLTGGVAWTVVGSSLAILRLDTLQGKDQIEDYHHRVTFAQSQNKKSNLKAQGASAFWVLVFQISNFPGWHEIAIVKNIMPNL